MIVGYESGDRADSQEHQEGRNHRYGDALHRELPQAWPGDSRRFHRRPSWKKPRDTLRKTIDFAKRVDAETIQVSIAHAFPGTEFYDYAKKNNLVTINMADDEGHQLPNVIYPGILDRAELVDWVERFYGEYYFRPKADWRIVRKAMFDSADRKRLYKEARSFMSLRTKRRKFVADHKAGLLDQAEERA